MQKRKKQKIVVVIPTIDRSNYLKLTLSTILEQARDHKHDAEIIVSDMSQNPKKNNEVIAGLRKKFPKTPIHYYPRDNNEIIEKALAGATDEEKAAYEAYVPPEGHWGAHRNRLSLLAAYHGGKNALYLHLDDDTPIAVLDEKNRIIRTKEDMLGKFVNGFRKARKQFKKGFCITPIGVSDALVSQYGVKDPKKLRQYISQAKPINERHQRPMGPGRILGYANMRIPYIPFGRNSDATHSIEVGRYLKEKSSGKKYKGGIMHIGASGFSPQVTIEHELKKIEMATLPMKKHWLKLADRMTKMKKTL